MVNFFLILANHLVGFILWISFTKDEVEVNRVMIVADGSNDTLGKGFHERRTWIRFWHWLACTIIGGLPAAAFVSWAAMGWSFAALGLLLAGYFLRTFSPMLNAALQLDWKARFYVSFSLTASKLDKFAVWVASKVYANWKEAADMQRPRGNKVFQIMLNISLVLTLSLYLLLVFKLVQVISTP